MFYWVLFLLVCATAWIVVLLLELRKEDAEKLKLQTQLFEVRQHTHLPVIKTCNVCGWYKSEELVHKHVHTYLSVCNHPKQRGTIINAKAEPPYHCPLR